MTKSIFTAQYDRLCALLIRARIDAGFSQAELARCLQRPQSFVSKYETKQRRLDVVEFLEVAHCINANVPEFLERLADASADTHNASELIARSERSARRAVRSSAIAKAETNGEAPARRSLRKR